MHASTTPQRQFARIIILKDVVGVMVNAIVFHVIQFLVPYNVKQDRIAFLTLYRNAFLTHLVRILHMILNKNMKNASSKDVIKDITTLLMASCIVRANHNSSKGIVQM